MEPLRIVCISPFFAPLANAEAICGGKVALHLLKAGVELTAISVDYSGHTNFFHDASDLWSPLTSVTYPVPPAGGRSRLLSGPLALRYQIVAWSRWVSATVSLARGHHRVTPFDLVYSRGLPSVAHIAAYWIARAVRRPWVANFNDPWDLEGTHLLPQHRNRRKRSFVTRVSDVWMHRVMRTADALTFPCARLRDYHLRLAQPRGECHVIPHVGHTVERQPSSDHFQLVHAGNLGVGESTRRNTTTSLLRGVQLFLDRRPDARSTFRLVLVGPEDLPTLALAKEANVAANVLCTGRVSYLESLRRIAAATVCLLVEGNIPEGIYLPSKFPDYIHARKPVIALSPSTGTIADLLPATGITQVPVNDPAAIEKAIAQHYDMYANGRLASLEPTEDLRQMYDGSRIGGVLRKLFTELHHRRAPVAGMAEHSVSA